MQNFQLPDDYRPYIDKYFLRAKEVLQKENLNPTVKAQVFIRKGNCKVFGLNEAIAILTKYAGTQALEIHSLEEGDMFQPGETLMTIKAPIQSIIDLETMYLGVLSAETTIKNGGNEIQMKDIATNLSKITDIVDNRPISYFGARHWRYDCDRQIAAAAFAGDAQNCSTDAGGETQGQQGIGTIPHALECIYHWKHGLKRAVVEATKAFDRHMIPAIPRIALVDYANREIADTLLTINEVPNLYGIRIDTCGENYMQGCFAQEQDESDPYLFNTGVSILGTTLLYKLVKDEGNYKVILSSGFGNIEKVKAFIEAEEILEQKIFDGLGIGGLYESRMATMDIIEVEGQTIHKTGRVPKPNDRLRRIV